MADLVGATNSLRSELQPDGQLFDVLLGAGKFRYYSSRDHSSSRDSADRAQYSWRAAGGDCQQYFYDRQTGADAHLHRDRAFLSQPTRVRVGRAAINGRILAVRSVVAL